MKTFIRILGLMTLAFALFTGQAQAALTLPGSNTFITEGSATPLMAGTGYSERPDVSADGTRIVFESYAANLTADTDTNNQQDIFLYDANTDTFTLISKNMSGTDTGNANSNYAKISADGSTVIFLSNATDLTADAANGFKNLYIYDVATETTTRIGPIVDTNIGVDDQYLSADGDKVVFSASKPPLTGDTDNNNSSDVFLYDKSEGTITLVSEAVGGGETANGASGPDSISADGSLIVFGSNADNLISTTDTNATFDLFLYEVATGDITLITNNKDDNDTGDDLSRSGIISADGSTVAFESRASDLTTDTDTNGAFDIFLYDVGTATTTFVTQNLNGNNSGNDDSTDPDLSADGSRLVFRSEANDLTADAKNNSSFEEDIFLYEAGTITLISKNTSDTGGGNEGSLSPQIAADGTIIAYQSNSTDLTTDTDANGTSGDVFIYDVTADTTTLVSKNASGTASADDGSGELRLSSDGSVIAFESQATDLVPIPDLNGDNDIFRYEVASDTVTIVSAAPFPAGSANDSIFDPSISADGTRIVFMSDATNLTPEDDTNNDDDVFLYDALTGDLTLISKNTSGTAAGDGRSREATISANGSTVVFQSEASDLTADNDTNQTYDVFVYDVDTGTLTLVSLNEAGTSTGNDDSRRASISDDGSMVVFESEASDLTADTDTNGLTDIFLYDVGSGNMTLISKNEAGTDTANSSSTTATLSGDGSTVAFRSRADDLTADTDTNARNDIFLYDVGSGLITLVTQNMAEDNTGNDDSSRPVLSFDGSVLAFRSQATDLTGEAQTANRDDAFVYDVSAETLTLASVDPAGTNGANDGVNGLSLSTDGTLLAFYSVATNLATTDTNNANDIFLYDVTGDALTLVSSNSAGTDTANGDTDGSAISADSSTLVYHSTATNITTDTNSFGDYNIYAYDVATGDQTLITTNTAGTDAGNGHSFNPALSSAGDIIVYSSSATNLTTDTLVGGIANLFLFAPQPAAPTGLSAVYDSVNGQINLTWTDNATTETGYVIERSANGGLTSVKVTLSANTTAVADTNLGCGGTYIYQVTATNLGVESAPSNVASADVICPENPSFEDTLSLWQTSSNANRFSTGQAYDGGAALLLQNPGSLDFARQTVNLGGQSGDTVTLTFYVAGKNVPTSGSIGGRIELMSGGAAVDTANCLYTGTRGTFNWQQVTCQVTASGSYDGIRVTVGAQGVGGGLIGFDAVEVTQQ